MYVDIKNPRKSRYERHLEALITEPPTQRRQFTTKSISEIAIKRSIIEIHHQNLRTKTIDDRELQLKSERVSSKEATDL